MLSNRSMPNSTVIPTLAYPDVPAAADWLCAAFGFTPRLRIGSHRIQLNVGDGCVVVTHGDVAPGTSQGVMVRVADVNAHHAQAEAAGATILESPQDYPYGERQYSAADLAGHVWTFSQTIADADPAEWGGLLLNQ
ncbi:MAG: VOC family protein [Anaerolineales bacterium]|nr:VOC family protein [Anaerolineales bacterium]